MFRLGGCRNHITVTHQHPVGALQPFDCKTASGMPKEKNRKNGITGWMLYNDRTAVKLILGAE